MQRSLVLLLLVASITACTDPVRPPEATRAAVRESAPNVTTMFAVTVKDLGTLPGGKSSRAIGNNDKGQVVGSSLDASGLRHAVVWSPTGVIRALRSLAPGHQCQANHINESGQIVGRCENANGNLHAVLWSPTGAIRDLGVLPGATTSNATDINDNGVVVGESDRVRAFRWTAASGMRELVGGTCGSSLAVAERINNRGQVAGIGESAVCHTQEAVVWSPSGAARHLGYFRPTGQYDSVSAGQGINDLGHVVGYGYASCPQGSSNDCGQRAFRWTPATGLRKLALVCRSGCNEGSVAYATNNHDVVVGWRSTNGATVFTHAVVWTAANVAQDLGVLLGGFVSQANDINGSNQVVGWSEVGRNRFHAVLWTLH